MSEINLSALPAPTIIEALSFEAIRAALIADLQVRYPAFTIALESDPAVKLIEVFAYRETLLRARINDAARACMLAFAVGTDLEQLAAWWGVSRRVLVPADPTAVPPVSAVLESDTSLRARTQAALEGLTCAGPIGAYRAHAMAASALVLDAAPYRARPGRVAVPVLSEVGDGTADESLLALVRAALNAEDIRPLCDTVEVYSATPLPYAITATLHVAAGPSAEVVQSDALAAVTSYCDEVHRVAARVAWSGISAALHRPGVTWVEILSPAADIVATADEAPYCTDITLTTQVEA